jgi:16S rRNA (guanine(966)-N(2))-methyltransferase RsmD
VRITGGRFRGRFLTVPAGARPTVGRVREALFSIWADALPDARLLELFAGSGVVSCEALGRGARSAVLIDSSAPVARRLGDNVAGLDLEDAATIYRMTLPRDLARLDSQRFDLVFADPPYSFTGHTALLTAVAPLVAEGGEVVLEHGARAQSPATVAGFERIDQRVYGESALSRYRRG